MTPPLSAEAVRRMTATMQRPVARAGVRPPPDIARERRARIRALHAQRVPMAQIVAEIGISRTAVTRYLTDPPGPKPPAHLTCPKCGRKGWCEVTNTRGNPDGTIHRRRECSCGARFSTVETVQP